MKPGKNKCHARGALQELMHMHATGARAMEHTIIMLFSKSKRPNAPTSRRSCQPSFSPPENRALGQHSRRPDGRDNRIDNISSSVAIEQGPTWRHDTKSVRPQSQNLSKTSNVSYEFIDARCPIFPIPTITMLYLYTTAIGIQDSKIG